VNHVPLDLLNALTQQELRRRGTPPMVLLGIEEINRFLSAPEPILAAHGLVFS
jgi:hypothetical protein